MSVKNQALVGVPTGTEADKATRLTWVVCMDFTGIVPAALARYMSRGAMWLPMAKLKWMEKNKTRQDAGSVRDDEDPLDLAAARTEIARLQAKVDGIPTLTAQLTSLRAEVDRLRKEGSST